MVVLTAMLPYNCMIEILDQKLKPHQKKKTNTKKSDSRWSEHFVSLPVSALVKEVTALFWIIWINR